MSAIEQIIEYQKEFKKLSDFIKSIVEVKASKPGGTSELQKSLDALPLGGVMGSRIEDLRKQFKEALRQRKQELTDESGRILSSFIRVKREGKTGVRERDRGHWRIAHLLMSFESDTSSVQFLYNNEILIPKTPVTSLDDLLKAEKISISKLNEFAIPEEELVPVFHIAYKEAVRKTNRDQGTPSGNSKPRVPISNLYYGLRMAMTATDIERKKSGRLRYPEFPLYAFLYNCDRYCQSAGQIPDGERIIFETGSQSETKNGMVFNGIRSEEDYKIYCFVKAYKEIMG
jgi:hypothetical protein